MENLRRFDVSMCPALELAESTIEVFRFWTFLKSACAQGLYGALDLKNTPCAKKIQKFYLYPIAHGGLISMPISFKGNPLMTSFLFKTIIT